MKSTLSQADRRARGFAILGLDAADYPRHPYTCYEDWSRLQYGRLLWKKAGTRERLLRHWTDERHPYHRRFTEEWRPLVEEVLTANPVNDEALDADLQRRGYSLRVVMREIPPVFGSFY